MTAAVHDNEAEDEGAPAPKVNQESQKKKKSLNRQPRRTFDVTIGAVKYRP